MHVRFSPHVIKSTYLVNNPHFISCSNDSYLRKFDMLKGIRKGGRFLLNTQTPLEELEAFLPNKVKRQLAEKEVKFYIINAADLAYNIGLGRRTNTIMQSAFFKLNEQLMPFDRAKQLMKEYAKASYGRRGEAVVKMNYDAIDVGGDHIVEVPVKKEWLNLKAEVEVKADRPDFVTKIADVVNSLQGDTLPVSAFLEYEDGHIPQGTAAYEKRGVANYVPEWLSENCIQCNQCVFACPHAVIRAFLADEKEVSGAPENAKMVQARGRDLAEYKYTIQVSVLDCTECGVCVEACPALTKHYKWIPSHDELEKAHKQVLIISLMK